MHPVVEQILAFFSNLLRNSFLTGKHHMLASFDSGTIAYDKADLHQITNKVRTAYQGSSFNSNEFLNDASYEIVKAIQERDGRDLPMPLLEAIFAAVFDLIHAEFFLLEISDAKDGWEQKLDLMQEHELKKWFARRLHFIENSDILFTDASEKLIILFTGLIKNIPLTPTNDIDSSILHLEAPLMSLIDDPAKSIERTVATLFDKDISDAELFHDTREQLFHNIKLASGYDPCHGAASSSTGASANGQRIKRAKMISCCSTAI